MIGVVEEEISNKTKDIQILFQLEKWQNTIEL